MPVCDCGKYIYHEERIEKHKTSLTHIRRMTPQRLCEICNVHVREDRWDRHLTMGNHLRVAELVHLRDERNALSPMQKKNPIFADLPAHLLPKRRNKIAAQQVARYKELMKGDNHA